MFWCHLWWRFEQVWYSQVGPHTDRGQWPPGQQQDPGWHSFYPGHPDTGTSRHRLLSASGSRKEWQGHNLNRRVSLSEVVSETHHCWLDNARPARLGERQRKCWCRQELFDRKYQDVKHITWHPPLSHTLHSPHRPINISLQNWESIFRNMQRSFCVISILGTSYINEY